MGETNSHELLDKMRHKLRLDKIPPFPRKILVTIVGGVFLVAGLVMVVMPGPAFVFIPLGLLVLASEFKWAERWSQRLMDVADKAKRKWRSWRRRRAVHAKS